MSLSQIFNLAPGLNTHLGKIYDGSMTNQLEPRKSTQSHKLSEEEFKKRFGELFYDPFFDKNQDAIQEFKETAWLAYQKSRKAPKTQKAGPDYQDPDYDLSSEWIEAKKRVDEAQKIHNEGRPEVLIICASNRNDQTCPGEISKTSRLFELAEKTLRDQGITPITLDLSRITSEYGKMIYPCKGCVSTAMPLCHWPCSCYPNHSLGQVHDWMNDIYPLWVRAQGIMIVTPVYWHQAPSTLKLMMDRLVCADGGNPDPTSTQGKKANLAKEIELKGWDYPRHLKGRFYSVIVHGDATGVDELANALSEWLEDMQLIPCGNKRILSRYIGYYQPYATSHFDLDKDSSMQTEVVETAKAMAICIKSKLEKKLEVLDFNLKDPRPK